MSVVLTADAVDHHGVVTARVIHGLKLLSFYRWGSHFLIGAEYLDKRFVRT